MNIDLGPVVNWLFGGGLVALLGLAVKLKKDLRQVKVDAARSEADRQEQRAKEARFDADIAASSTKIAGEGVLQGLLKTIMLREKQAHEAMLILQEQLREARESVANYREELAEVKEQEEAAQRDIIMLQKSVQTLEAAHHIEMRTLRTRVYGLASRLRDAGGVLTGTDVIGDKQSIDPVS